ncbi:MAG: phosphoenolpyruvate--protein phosphotransferase [Pirellulaceae bacterium]
MTSTGPNRQLHGVGISPGFAIGRAHVYAEVLPGTAGCDLVGATRIDAEYARFERARDSVIEELNGLISRVRGELDIGLADIFRAHKAILSDPAILREISVEIERTSATAEQAVQSVLERWKAKFEASTHYLLRDRVDDIEDIRKRLLSTLMGVRNLIENIPTGSVLIAKRLLPSEIVLLRERALAGIVIENCGVASHSAILARSMEIPIAAQIPDATEIITTGTMVLVDGIVGRVVIEPDQNRIGGFQERVNERARVIQLARERCHQPAVTLDGTNILVMANAGCVEDVHLGLINGADGIGLFRLEQFYLSQNDLPLRDKIMGLLRDGLRNVDGKPMTLRLLDAGADKLLPCLPQRRESNPSLGRRGVRLLLDHAELLSSQLEAMLSLSQKHTLRILVPMVTFAQDMRRVREAAERIAQDLRIDTIPQIGAMIETPAAALCVAEISEFADFLSIGTNDLTQYTMAADRDDEFLSDYYVDKHPAIMKLIQHVCSSVRDKEVSVCGELAGDPEAIPQLLEMGIRHLSVLPLRIPAVKERARNVEMNVNGRTVDAALNEARR